MKLQILFLQFRNICRVKMKQQRKPTRTKQNFPYESILFLSCCMKDENLSTQAWKNTEAFARLRKLV